MYKSYTIFSPIPSFCYEQKVSCDHLQLYEVRNLNADLVCVPFVGGYRRRQRLSAPCRPHFGIPRNYTPRPKTRTRNPPPLWSNDTADS